MCRRCRCRNISGCVQNSGYRQGSQQLVISRTRKGVNRIMSKVEQYQITWIRLPPEVPKVFLQRVPATTSPFSIRTCVSPGDISPTSASGCQKACRIRLICFGMMRLKICFPVHSGRGFKIVGIGIFPSKSSHHIKMFMNTSCTDQYYLRILYKRPVPCYFLLWHKCQQN